jgi:hypothetical protein
MRHQIPNTIRDGTSSSNSNTIRDGTSSSNSNTIRDGTWAVKRGVLQVSVRYKVRYFKC